MPVKLNDEFTGKGAGANGIDSIPSPLIRDFRTLRANHGAPNTLMVFRLGDFYELFMDDAIIASPLLKLALTRRNEMPMCGFPYHAAQKYIDQLKAAGWDLVVIESRN